MRFLKIIIVFIYPLISFSQVTEPEKIEKRVYGLEAEYQAASDGLYIPLYLENQVGLRFFCYNRDHDYCISVGPGILLNIPSINNTKKTFNVPGLCFEVRWNILLNKELSLPISIFNNTYYKKHDYVHGIEKDFYSYKGIKIAFEYGPHKLKNKFSFFVYTGLGLGSDRKIVYQPYYNSINRVKTYEMSFNYLFGGGIRWNINRKN